MSRTTMVADSWKPLRTNRCFHCKRQFVEGEPNSHYIFCGRCYPKMRSPR